MKTIENKYFYIFVYQLHRNHWKLSENKNKAIELTVNQRVAGSSPAGGAKKEPLNAAFLLLCTISTSYTLKPRISITSVTLTMLTEDFLSIITHLIIPSHPNTAHGR